MFKFRSYTPELLDGRDIPELDLFQNLKEFSVTFWNGTEFVQQWDSRANQTQNKLPKLVKIYLSKYMVVILQNNF
jgi:hypothetical protein